MPILTGSLADVVGGPLVAGQVRQAFVKAPAARGSLVSGDRLIVSAPVPVDAAGTISLELETGPAVLVVDTYAGGPDVYDLYVTEDMSLLSEAVAEAAPARERSWVESVMVQLRDEAVAAAERAETAADDVDDAISGAADAVVQAVEDDRVAAETAATSAAGSATAADASAGDASAAASAASGSAGDAAGSAADAGSSATAAAGSATDAGAARDGAVAARTGAESAAQVVTDNLAAIEAAPGHAAAAQAARAGAEDAEDAAGGSATAAAGSATAAADSASDAATSATDADNSADAAAGSATTAAGHAGTATTQAGLATNAKTTAVDAASAASGHADAAAGSASAASGSAVTASTKAGEAASSATDAAAALAQVLVELANTQAYQDVLTAIGDMSSNWNADIAAALADLVGQAPETLDTIEEIATALGNDPNFFTTIMDAIGQKVGNNDPRLSDARTPTTHTHLMVQVDGLEDALDGKSDVGHGHLWSQIGEKPGTFPSTIALVAGLQAALDGKSDVGHTHNVSEPWLADALDQAGGGGSWDAASYGAPDLEGGAGIGSFSIHRRGDVVMLSIFAYTGPYGDSAVYQLPEWAAYGLPGFSDIGGSHGSGQWVGTVGDNGELRLENEDESLPSTYLVASITYPAA